MANTPRYCDVYLLSNATEDAPNGDTIRTPARRKLTAKLPEVGVAEFYQAAASPLRPERKAEVWQWQYKGEKQIVFADDKQVYTVIKATRVRAKMVLTCQVGVVDVGSA